VTGALRRLALVASIPLLLWGALEAAGLLKVRAPGVPHDLTSLPGIPAQPAPPDPLGQPAAAIQEPSEPQRIAQVPSPACRPVSRTLVHANLSHIMQMEAAIQKYSRAYGVDEDLVWAVVRQESGFNPAAVSPKGAMGLMQLMPGTAASLGVSDPFDVEQNIAGGIKYLVICLKQFNGDIGLALAAYNAGPDNVIKYQGCPPFSETTKYVAAVLQDYAGPPRARVFDLRPPEPASSREITAIGGSGLQWRLPMPTVKTPKTIWRIAPPRWKVFPGQGKAPTIAAKSSAQVPALR
jgi:hypothetical protein